VTNDVGLEVLSAVIIKTSIFWNITSCSPLRVNRRLGGIYRIHLRGRKTRQTQKPRERMWQFGSVCHLPLWRFPPKHRFTSHGLHVVIFQKIEHFTWIMNWKEFGRKHVVIGYFLSFFWRNWRKPHYQHKIILELQNWKRTLCCRSYNNVQSMFQKTLSVDVHICHPPH
jgi:hypothetical protein